MGEERTGETEDADRRPSRRVRQAALAAVVVVAAVAGIFVIVVDDDEGSDDATTADVVVDTVPTGDSPEPLTYVLRATVERGARARITNEDDIPHTFTSDDGLFDTGTVGAGQSVDLPSLPEGTYDYHCEIHPALTGELVVTG